MEYNDEKILSPEEYQNLAKAYTKNMKERGYLFVRLDNSSEEALKNECFELFHLLKSSLLSLSGFLGTGVLYNLNEKQLEKFHNLYSFNIEIKPMHITHDKTKCFLNMLSLENQLINKLLSLALASDYHKEIFEIIKERTSLSSSLYKINGAISSYFQ